MNAISATLFILLLFIALLCSFFELEMFFPIPSTFRVGNRQPVFSKSFNKTLSSERIGRIEGQSDGSHTPNSITLKRHRVS